MGPELNLSNGYRNDTLQRTNTLKFAPYEVDQKDHIKVNNINLWQIGVDGRLMLSKEFYLKGFAFWGFGGGAKLHEQISGYHFLKQFGNANVPKARTYDYQIGLGYLFERKCWNLGISSGYAYDKQRIQVNRGKIAFSDAPIYRNQYKTTTIWKGPWVGGELFYNQCAWRCSLGYEYHFAHYKAHHSIPHYPLAFQQGLPSHTTSSNAHGNVLFLDGRYLFCRSWQIGAFFKYQNWRAEKGHLSSNYFALNGYSPKVSSSATGKWTSYSINLDIGYAL